MLTVVLAVAELALFFHFPAAAEPAADTEKGIVVSDFRPRVGDWLRFFNSTVFASCGSAMLLRGRWLAKHPIRSTVFTLTVA